VIFFIALPSYIESFISDHGYITLDQYLYTT